MVQLTVQERVFIVKTYFETHSFQEIQRLFALQFPQKTPPVKSTLWRTVKNYLNHGTSLNRNPSNSGRKRTGRSQDNIEAVHDELIRDPKGVTCRVNNLNIPSATFNRIVRIDLKWHPYKIQRWHELKIADYARRVRFSRWFLEKNRSTQFLSNLVIGDEAGFWMNGQVSSQNVRKYAPKGNNPEFTYEVSASKEKLMVWMGLAGNGTVLGPFFLDGSVTGAKYLKLLNEEVFPQLVAVFGHQFNNGSFSRLWWAQDGAPAHTSVDISTWMTEFFRHKIIALHHPYEWPPRSPDLTPCDFFLWGYLKSKVYQTAPSDIQDLTQRIVSEADAIKQNPQLVKRAMRDMLRRARVCADNNGRHVRGTHG